MIDLALLVIPAVVGLAGLCLGLAGHWALSSGAWAFVSAYLWLRVLTEEWGDGR